MAFKGLRYYASTDLNAPVLSGQVDALLTLLDAVLVNGLTAVAVTSIARSGATATLTSAAAHGLNTGQEVLIAGADQAEYNGTFVVTVTSSTVFTYTVSGSPATPATGTITCRRAPAGWSIELTGTSKRVYRPAAGTRKRLRVLDSGPGTGSYREARAYGAHSFSDVDTGVTMFPTAAQLAAGIIIRKSNTLDATARAWKIVATPRFFVLNVQDGGAAGVWSQFYFGDFYDYLPGSAHNCCICGRITELAANTTPNYYETVARHEIQAITTTALAVQNGFYLAGNAAGSAGSIAAGKIVNGAAFGLVGNQALGGRLTLPNPSDGAVVQSRFQIFTGACDTLRGYLFGISLPLHASSAFADGDTYDGAGELSGAEFVALQNVNAYVSHASTGANSGTVALETSDPTYSA